MDELAKKARLGERHYTVFRLVEDGAGFTAIAKQMGISCSRVRQIYFISKRKLSRADHWTDGLSTRSVNCFRKWAIESRDDALKAFRSGRLRPDNKGPRNYGWLTHKEVAKWLGLPEPKKPNKPKSENPWAENDPRMWREQCKVGDVAFQHLFCVSKGLPLPDWVKDGLPQMYQLLGDFNRYREVLQFIASTHPVNFEPLATLMSTKAHKALCPNCVCGRCVSVE